MAVVVTRWLAGRRRRSMPRIMSGETLLSRAKFHWLILSSALQALVDRTRRALALAGLIAVLESTDGWRSNHAVGLQKVSERYLRMQEHFDRVGPWGRRTMRQTAGLHVCMSLLPDAPGREQWLLANLMAPVLQAMFANSTVLEGRRSPVRVTGHSDVHCPKGIGGLTSPTCAINAEASFRRRANTR